MEESARKSSTKKKLSKKAIRLPKWLINPDASTYFMRPKLIGNIKKFFMFNIVNLAVVRSNFKIYLRNKT